MFEYQGLYFYTHPKVYEPAEDSFLLAENVETTRKDEVLEIGTGTGIIAIIAARTARNVVATDINPHAIECTTKNLIANRIFNVELKEGDLFEPVVGKKFNLIIFNTPYLPTDEDEKKDDLNAAWDGGSDGRKVIDRFLSGILDHLEDKGRLFMVQSSLSDVAKTLTSLEQMGLNASVIATKKCFFEEIVLISAQL
ncbi:MAG TPA: HemK2/MTQ2 family protein methyltransferase [Methanobacteriaceae archaeon]|nr:HemK2/MTQ2 family protein methyltransferase [Methanobacteriaceae archaeon]